MSPSVAVPELSTAICDSLALAKLRPFWGVSSPEPLPSITLVPRAEKLSAVPSALKRLIEGVPPASMTRTSPVDWLTATLLAKEKLGCAALPKVSLKRCVLVALAGIATTMSATSAAKTETGRTRRLAAGALALLPLASLETPRVASAPRKTRPRPAAGRWVDPAVDAFAWRLT